MIFNVFKNRTRYESDQIYGLNRLNRVSSSQLSSLCFFSLSCLRRRKSRREKDRRMSPEDFQKKLSITDSSLAGEMEIECGVSGGGSSSSTVGSGVASQTLVLLRSLLEIQQRRAQAYAKLKRFDRLSEISRKVMPLVRVMFIRNLLRYNFFRCGFIK